MKKMWYCLYEEYLMRILINFFNDNYTQKEIWRQFNYEKLKSIMKKEKIKEKKFDLDYQNKNIIEALKKANLYNSVVNIISLDKIFWHNIIGLKNMLKQK